MTIQFQKAARHAVKLKIGIDGPSGAGKTMGALALAQGVTSGGRVAVGDSENGSASLYADRFAFDTVTIPDAKPSSYVAIIDAAVAGGYDALVLDSLTHAWQHVLSAKDDYDRANPKSNQFANWGRFSPQWESLIRHILNAPIHIIATMRSKQAYEQVENGGRKQVVKLGLQPQVRDGAEYEFGIVFSVNHAHRAEATKDRTGLFSGDQLNLCDPALHSALVQWMNEGGPLAPVAPAPVTGLLDEDRKMGGTRLGDYTTYDLEKAVKKHRNDPKYAQIVEACVRILATRALGMDESAAMARVEAEMDREAADLPFAQ